MTAKGQYEVIIVGGGIAGASLAYFLQARGVRDVLIVEREEQPAYHATGRSAAALVEVHAEPVARHLITLGAAFLRQPPAGFAEHPLVDPIGVVAPAGGEAWPELRRLGARMREEGVTVEEIGPDDVLARVPALARESIDGALFLPEDGHLDVNEILAGYLRHHARAGGTLLCSTEVTGVVVEGGRCRGVETTAGRLAARWVVNAAGAWAQAIGRLAGAAPLALQPRRRTIITFAPPEPIDPRGWPMIDCESRGFYFKPEPGGLLMSPMDTTDMEPCDARPSEENVAEAVDRLARWAPALVPRVIHRKWAGLRTFAPDAVPVVGADPILPGFFWVVGQGGVGMETSPAIGRIAADLLVDGRTDAFDARLLSPDRFR